MVCKSALLTLTEGMSSIVAEVRDPSNDAGRFELAFFIDTNIAPQAQIVSPAAASVFYANQVVSFEGMVSDNEDNASDLEVEWRSSLDGTLIRHCTNCEWTNHRRG